MNKLIGMIGLTVGGGLIGAGVQRSYTAGHKLASKMFGNVGLKMDETAWTLLLCGLAILLIGVFFSGRKGS